MVGWERRLSSGCLELGGSPFQRKGCLSLSLFTFGLCHLSLVIGSNELGAISVTGFDGSVWPRSDAELGIAGNSIETFEDVILATGLHIEVNAAGGNYGPTNVLPNVFDPNNATHTTSPGFWAPGLWDGNHALINRDENRQNQTGILDDSQYGDVSFHFPGGANSVGFSLFNVEFDTNLVVNGNLVTTLGSIPNISTGSGRQGYILVLNEVGDPPIMSVKLDNVMFGGIRDGWVIDYLAFVPESSGQTEFSVVDDFSTTANTDANTWSYRWKNGLGRDGDYSLLTDLISDSNWVPQVPTWTNSGSVLPIVGINDTGEQATWIGNPSTFFWLENTVHMHPDVDKLAIVSWLSPADALVDISFRFTDVDPGGGDGVDWFVDLGSSDGQIQAGTLANGGDSGIRTEDRILVHAGERINFIVGPGSGNDFTFDSTRLGATILATFNPFVYGIKSFAPVAGGVSSAPAILFRFTVDGDGLSEIGTITLGGVEIDADGLSVSPTFDLRAFRIEDTGSTLISISKVDASATILADTILGREIRGGAFDHQDNLWIIDAVNDEVFRIHATTAAILSAPTPLMLNGELFDLSDSSDITFDVFGNAYLSSGDSIFALEPDSGTLTEHITDSGQFLAGIAFAKAAATDIGLFAFEVVGTEDLFTYDIDGVLPRSDLFLNIFPSFNAGRGDLGAAIKVQPSLVEKSTVSIRRTDSNIELRWEAALNHVYRVWHSSSLRDEPWSVLEGLIIIEEDDVTKATDIGAITEDQRFYFLEATLGP